MQNKNRYFIFISSLLSLIHALGYILHGFNTEFNIFIYTMVILDFLYIPAILYKKEKHFPVYLGLFSVCLIFITAFTNSRLYNNYSGLLCLFIGLLIYPRLRNIFMILYLFIAALAFSLAGDNVYFLMIHAARALWAFTLYNFIIYERYNRKPVILYPDEKEILRQLNDNKLLKEIEYNNYSERTIRRRLEAARARNGVKTNDDLKELYNKTYNNN